MSKITRDDAKKQAKRLQSCPMLAPQTDEGRKEIVDCLVRHCQSADHAEDVMTQVLDNSVKVEGPITAYIALTARNTRPAEGQQQGFAGCERCDWSGWVQKSSAGQGTASPCECRANVVPPPAAGKPWREGESVSKGKPGAMDTAADWAKRAAGDL